ncbi:unnamed protein product [Rotaria magnacalcarata]|uniref:Exocyst complex component Sec3 C-terminal domain-containing protein n=1 Tax=Rotaria magnacalcarata TaxID=392030 RepID=A0A8S3J8V6_9BILA|nr:unnamed protein product [Rotaria magnacalcarata]
MVVQNFGAFLNKLFASNLILLKRDVDSYISETCKRIREYRPVKNRRIGILPYVNYFSEFSEEAEVIFDKSARAVDLHRVYKNLVTAIFQGIEECASAMIHDAKTPDSMVRLGKKFDLYDSETSNKQNSKLRRGIYLISARTINNRS